jgi:hypothetical protein
MLFSCMSAQNVLNAYNSQEKLRMSYEWYESLLWIKFFQQTILSLTSGPLQNMMRWFTQLSLGSNGQQQYAVNTSIG